MANRCISDLRRTKRSAFGIEPAGSTGAPGSGTYRQGDEYVDSAGMRWVCTTGGTPGTWRKTSGTMAAQDANAVAITGGAIDGTTIGATSASTVKGTTIEAESGVITSGSNTTTGSDVRINCAAANAASVKFRSAGVDRWALLRVGTSHDFHLSAYDSSGTLIDTPVTIPNASGPIDFSRSLTVNGVGVALGNFDFLNVLTNAVSAITGTASPTTFGTLYKCTGTSADYTVTLPAVSGNAGKFMAFRGGTASELTKVVTIDGNGSEKIQTGRLSIALLWDEFLVLYCDGTQWWLVQHTHADWQSFTPNITAVTTNPVKGTRTETCYWRRVGALMQIKHWYQQTAAGSGTSGTGTYLWDVPGGFLIDSTRMPVGDWSSSSATGSNVGNGNMTKPGVSAADFWVNAWSTSKLNLFTNAGGFVGSGSGYTFNVTALDFDFHAELIISGW